MFARSSSLSWAEFLPGPSWDAGGVLAGRGERPWAGGDAQGWVCKAPTPPASMGACIPALALRPAGRHGQPFSNIQQALEAHSVCPDEEEGRGARLSVQGQVARTHFLPQTAGNQANSPAAS